MRNRPVGLFPGEHHVLKTSLQIHRDSAVRVAHLDETLARLIDQLLDSFSQPLRFLWRQRSYLACLPVDGNSLAGCVGGHVVSATLFSYFRLPFFNLRLLSLRLLSLRFLSLFNLRFLGLPALLRKSSGNTDEKDHYRHGSG